MIITQLNKDIALNCVNNLIEIDKVIMDESWTSLNFSMDLNRKWELSLLASENSRIIGFLICSVKKDYVHVHRIAVLPSYHQKKSGTRLMERLFSKCYELDLKIITLKVKDSNVGACRFYEKLGFKKVGNEGSRYLYKRQLNDECTI